MLAKKKSAKPEQLRITVRTLTIPTASPNIERMSSTAQVQQGQQAPPVHPPGEHSLAQLVRDNTNQGEMIVHFLIDAMRGRIDGAKTSHRIDAARLLLKLGCDDAPAFIADFSSHTRPGGGSAYSSGAIVDRHNRKYVTRLAKFVRTKTGDGTDLVNFLVDAMLGRPEDFKPAARLAAARELLRLGWETVPTVGRNRKARRSEAAANGLLVDSRKAAPNGPKANGPKANGPKANGAKTNGPKAAHNGARTSGGKTASNGAKAGGRKAAANGTKNLPGDRAHSSKIRQHQPAAAKAAAHHNGAAAAKDTGEPLTDRDDDSRQSDAPQHDDAPQQSNNPQHDDEEAPWYDRPTPPRHHRGRVRRRRERATGRRTRTAPTRPGPRTQLLRAPSHAQRHRPLARPHRILDRSRPNRLPALPTHGLHLLPQGPIARRPSTS